jgi:uncharacterized protein (DUF983 family)
MKMVSWDGLGKLYEGFALIVKSLSECGVDCQLTSSHLLIWVGVTVL